MPSDISAEGVYGKKLLQSKSRLIAFSHLRRFQVGVDVVAPLAGGKRVLDYGCGDGTFLQALLASGVAPLQLTGAEISEDLIAHCATRFPSRTGVQFARINELPAFFAQAPLDVIVCMEVLEHAVEPEALLDQMHCLLQEKGLLIVSVPVETGPVLLLKQAVRVVAGWRGIGDYQWTSRYTFSEYWKSLFAGSGAHIVRPIHSPPESHPFHCHKGFNWRHLESMIAQRFQIQRIFGSPFSWLPPFLGSQVWFVARKIPR